MEVEVKQSEGFHLKAVVNDIMDEGLDVVYEKGWRKPEVVKFEQCRAVLAESGQKPNFKVSDVVDAYVRIDKNDKEVMGWNKMKIRDIKNDFAVVDNVEGPQISDIIPINQCRHPALPTSISASGVKSIKIELSNDLLDYFSRSEENYNVLQQSIPAILIKFNREEKVLVVKTFSAAAIKKVEVLKDVFLSNCRQKMMLLQRQEEQKKMLSIHEPQPDSPFFIEFDVSTSFMGLAIGAQGVNISNARSLDGITEIKLDESTREQGYCKFKIFAQKAEAGEQARNMLEFLAQQKFVPQNKVGQVIGKQGKTIQDIVDKSGVVRVQIGDENPEQGMVPFSFTGTREAITHAELLVEFHLKHINEMDEIRAEEEEIRRKLYLSRNSPFQHYNGHQQQYQNQEGRQYQNNNNMRAQNGGGGNRQQQDGERRAGGVYRGGQQGGGQQQQRGGGGGQFNRYNNQQGGGGGSRAIGGGGRPYNAGGGAAGGRYAGGNGGRQYSGQQYRGGRGDRDQQQKAPQRDQQPQRNTNSPPEQQAQQESEDEIADNGTFNSAAQGSDDNSDKTNEKPQQHNSSTGAPPHRQQRNVTGGFGSGRTGVDRAPARNRRNKADDED